MLEKVLYHDTGTVPEHHIVCYMSKVISSKA